MLFDLSESAVLTALFFSFLGLIFKPVERDASYLSVTELFTSFLATFYDYYAHCERMQ